MLFDPPEHLNNYLYKYARPINKTETSNDAVLESRQAVKMTLPASLEQVSVHGGFGASCRHNSQPFGLLRTRRISSFIVCPAKSWLQLPHPPFAPLHPPSINGSFISLRT